MERITKSGYKFNLLNVLQGLNRYADVDEILNRLEAYEDTELEPKEIDHLREVTKMVEGISLDRLREIVEAEKDGRLVVLPCKIGNPVFRISNGMVFDDWEVAYADVYKDEVVLIDDSDNTILEGQIGKEVFFTRSEAEAALEKKEGKENDG